jgi:hypothetical protein
MNPEARIKAYLDANKGSLRFETIDQIVHQVKLFVFYGASPISDDDVRMIVSRWALFNPVWLLPNLLLIGHRRRPRRVRQRLLRIVIS